jgi:predicted metal-binding membrane protein
METDFRLCRLTGGTEPLTRRRGNTDAMSDTTLESLLRRDRVVVVAALLVMTGLAWGYILWLAGNMNMDAMPKSDMTGMGAMLAPAFRPWNATDFVVMFVMWTVMMVGMMTPSATPMIMMYASIGRQGAHQARPLAATGFFAGGYLLAWTAFSLVATLGQWLLERAALLTPMMATANAVLGAAVLIAAGLFQWTPVKDACLRHCQTPVGFIVQHGGFRHDAFGSLALGFRHGGYCIGCCWALMALLFVGGVMNILWIAGLTIYVLLEKVFPLGRMVSRAAGAGLLAWGVWLLINTLLKG